MRSESEDQDVKEVKTKITPKRYYHAIIQNNGTKGEIAEALGCSRMWLHKFEKSTGANKNLAGYLYLSGMNIDQITTLCGAKGRSIQEMELENLPTLDGIKEQIKRALEILEKASIFDDKIEARYYGLRRIYDMLEYL